MRSSEVFIGILLWTASKCRVCLFSVAMLGWPYAIIKIKIIFKEVFNELICSTKKLSKTFIKWTLSTRRLHYYDIYLLLCAKIYLKITVYTILHSNFQINFKDMFQLLYHNVQSISVLVEKNFLVTLVNDH